MVVAALLVAARPDGSTLSAMASSALCGFIGTGVRVLPKQRLGRRIYRWRWPARAGSPGAVEHQLVAKGVQQPSVHCWHQPDANALFCPIRPPLNTSVRRHTIACAMSEKLTGRRRTEKWQSAAPAERLADTNAAVCLP